MVRFLRAEYVYRYGESHVDYGTSFTIATEFGVSFPHNYGYFELVISGQSANW